jgi:hypothetical protein
MSYLVWRRCCPASLSISEAQKAGAPKGRWQLEHQAPVQGYVSRGIIDTDAMREGTINPTDRGRRFLRLTPTPYPAAVLAAWGRPEAQEKAILAHRVGIR